MQQSQVVESKCIECSVIKVDVTFYLFIYIFNIHIYCLFCLSATSRTNECLGNGISLGRVFLASTVV